MRAQTLKLSTLFSFLALLAVSVQSSSLTSDKNVSDHLLLYPSSLNTSSDRKIMRIKKENINLVLI